MSRPFRAASAQKPYRGDAPLNLPVGQVNRLALLRGSCNVPENQRRTAVCSQRAEWIRLTEEKRVSAQLGPKSPGRPESGINSASRELGVNRQQAQRAAKVAGLSDRAKDAADTALRACIVACSALFVACAGLAVTL